MQITYLGQSCFKIKSGATTLLTDPFSPPFVGLPLPKQEVEIVTISHDHEDHNDLSRLKNSPFLITAPGEYEVGGISVFGYPSFHDKEKKLANNIFIIEAEGIKICHLGDLGADLTQKELETLDGVDILLVNVGGKKTSPEHPLAVPEIVKLINHIEPYIAIPMHFLVPEMNQEIWGKLATLEEFLKEYGKEGEHLEKLSLTHADLKEEDTRLVILEKKELKGMPQDLKIPPHSDEAEESVLGALLIDQDAITNVAPLLQAEHFYNPNHEKIYEAILALYEEREPIDLVTVAEQLKKTKSLKKIGDRTYLTGLIEKVPTSAHAEYYAKIIRDMAVRRELISSASGLVQMAFDESVQTGALLDKGEQAIFSLSQRHLSRNFIPVKDALAESFDRLDSLQKSSSGLRGVPTGFKDLDNALAGMQASNLLILAGRPGLGKTALALNIAQFAAVKEKIPVGFFSLEMSKEELVDRLLVGGAEIDAWRLKTGKLTDDDFSRLSDAMGVLAEAPLYIDDSPGISVGEMRTKARRLQIEKDLKLLVVDYLQLATPGRRWDSRVQEVSEISQGLKNLARELKIPILALSQLSRAVEQRGTRVPQLADLRESGAIEQDADVVMFLYREGEEDLENINLSIAKHRNGPLRTIPLRFKGERIKFYPSELKRKD